MEIQDNPVQYENQQNNPMLLQEQANSNSSQVLTQILSADELQCFELICKMISNSQLKQSFKNSISNVNSSIFNMLSNKLNDKIQQIIRKVLIKQMQQKQSSKNSQDFQDKISLFFNALKSFYYSDKVVSPTIKVQETIIYFLKIVTHIDTFINLLGSINYILSRKHTQNHEKLGRQICWPLYQLIKDKNNKDLPEQISQKIKICKCLESSQEQTILIFKFQLIRSIYSTKIHQIQPPEEQLQSIIIQLRDKPYSKLLKHVIKYRRMHEQCDRIVDELLSCSITFQEKNKPIYKFKGNYLHQTLLTSQALQTVIRETGPQYIRFLNNDSFVVQDNFVYSKYSLKMLDSFYKKANDQQDIFQAEILYSVAENLKKLIQNSQKKIKIVSQNSNSMMESQQDLMPEITCKIFNIFTGYYNNYINDSSSIPSQGFMSQSTFNQFMNLILKWSGDQRIAKAPFMKTLVENLLAFTIYLSYRRTFQNILKWESQTSNNLINILKNVSPLNKTWIPLRNLKGLINRWVQTLPGQDARYNQILYLFFQIVFDPKSMIPSTINKSNRLFSSIKISRANNKIIVQEILKQLGKIKVQLEENQIKQNFSKYPQFQNTMQKILMLISTKQKLEVQKIGKELGYIYENFAHIVPSIYHYRTYIAEIYKNSESRSLVLNANIESLYSNFNNIKQGLKSLNLSQWITSTSKVVNEKIRDLINPLFKSFKLVTNSLQIKNINSLELSKKAYSLLIQIIRQSTYILSEGKSKIIYEMKQQPNKFKQALTKDYVMHANSLNQYSLFNMFDLSISNLRNVIRCYLCNSDKYLKKYQQYYLMSEIGNQIFLKIEKHSQMSQLTLAQHVKQTYKIINLFNDLMGISRLNQKSHLQKEQIQRVQQFNHRDRSNEIPTVLMVRQQPIPLNIFSSFYTHYSVRQNFFQIFKNIFEAQKAFKNIIQISQIQYSYQVRFCTQSELLKLNQLICQNMNKQINEDKKKKQATSNANNFDKNIEILIRTIFLPKIQTSNSGTWVCDEINNTAQDQIALGIIYDQINGMYSKLKSEQIINLQKYFDIFAQNFNGHSLLSKKSENQEDGGNVNPFRRRLSGTHRRDRQRQPDNERVRLELLTLNIQPEVVQAALDNQNFEDAAQAMEWISANQVRMQELIIQRSIRKIQSQNKKSEIIEKKQSSYKGQKIAPLDGKQFNQKFEKILRQLIKSVLLPNLFSENGIQVKGMLFVCLNSFSKAEFKVKQYNYFAEKMFKQLDLVKQIKSNADKNKIKIITQIIDSSLQRQPKVINNFYSFDTGVKLMNLLMQTDQQLGQKILKVVNNALPSSINGWNQQKAVIMKKYMSFICDVLNYSSVKSNYLSEILYKIASTKDQQLLKKVSKVICFSLSKGYLKNNIFSLIQLILQGDKNFIQACMELDIKGFIIQTYGYKSPTSSCKQNIMEIDIREFANGLKKYQGKPTFSQVSKKFFTKKKNKNKSLFYNFRQHDLLFNQALNTNNLSFNLNETTRFIIDSLIKLIVQYKQSAQEIQKKSEQNKKLKSKQKDQNNQKYFVQELQKVLDFYKLLIPYTVTRKIQFQQVDKKLLGVENDFISWLINCYSANTQGNGLNFIEFLMMRNSLLMKRPQQTQKMKSEQKQEKEKVQIISFSDYIVSRAVTELAVSSTKFSKESDFNIYWSTFLILFFMQIKSFNEKSRSPFSPNNKTSLVNILENSISKINLQELKDRANSQFQSNPLIYTLRSQCLYLIHKWRMIKNLSKSKYKLVQGGQNQNEKQYLPMDLFYGNQIMQNWKSFEKNSKNSRDLLGAGRGAQSYTVRDGQIRIRMNNIQDDVNEDYEGSDMDEEEQQQQQQQQQNYMDTDRIPIRRLPVAEQYIGNQRVITSIFQPIQPPIQAQNQTQIIQPIRPNQSQPIENIPSNNNSLRQQVPSSHLQEDSQMRDQSQQIHQSQIQMLPQNNQEKMIEIRQQQKKIQIKQQIEQEETQDSFIEQEPKYLVQFLQVFSQTLIIYQHLKAQTNNEKPEIILPGKIIELNEGSNYKVNINEPIFILEFSSPKTKIFQQRLSQIYKLLYSKKSWNIIGQNSKKNLTLRLSEALLGEGIRDLGGQMLNHIERLLNRRQQQQEAQQIRSRPLNMNQIMGRLEEYVQPIIPPIVQPVIPIVEPVIPPREQPKQQKKQSQKSEMIVEQKEQISEQKQQKAGGQKLAVQNQQKMQVQGQMKSQSQQQKPKISQQMDIQVEKKQQKPIFEQEKKVEQQKSKQQQNKEQQKPKSEENNQNLQMVAEQQVIQPPQPPQIHRPVLQILGLPQTFYQDYGLDATFFDSLPQEMQMDEITQYMNSQQYIRQQNQNNNGGNPGNIPPQNPMNDNAAFFASVDPTLRAQLLLQATPQVLASLPPQMRAQAQNARQRQISMMIEAQQQEEQQNYIASRGHPKLQTKNLKFPVVPSNYFPKVPQTLPDKLLKTIFININASNDNKFKVMGYRFLLENKLTRQKALTTLISLLRKQHFNHNETIIQCSIEDTKGQKSTTTEGINKWNFQKVQISQDIKKFRQNILKLIYQCIKTSAYKDEKFLQKRISIQGFEKYQIVKNLQLDSSQNKDTYDPQLQLLELGLSNHKSLAVQIMKTLKNQKIEKLPNCLLEKIVLATKRDKLPDSFYDHMEKLSENEQMKSLFLKYFPESSPPKIELLSKILKYKFAQLPYLTKMHEQAISSYNPNYNEFLNQIFSIYKKEDFKKLQPFLLKHKNVHFQIIKDLYAQGRSLQNEPLGIILRFPNLLDFETKKFLFRKHPKIRRSQGRYRLAVEVSRSNIFQDSYNQIMARTPRQLMGKLQVTFIDQPGYDAGGISRQWFECLSKQIFNPNYALFEHSSSGNTYQPNPKSYVNPDHLQYFKFIGRFVGKALAQGNLIDSYFTRAVYKIILGQQLQFQDLQQQDYNFYKSMKWMKQNNIQGIIDETFSYQYDHFGHLTVKQLVPGGRTIAVTQQNKQFLEYVQKYCLSKMRDNFSTQMNQLLQGFHDIIPQQCISFFEAKELQLLISGLPSIDLEDMKNNTDYSGYSPADQIIQWYWEILGSYTQDQLAKLVQFITGTSRIPAGGFSQIQGMNGLQKISIHKDPNSHQLPKAHTCFNQLDLPNYHSKQTLRERLRIAITQGHQGFGFM